MKLKMNERMGEFIVGLAFALRGTSLLFSKIALRTMGPMLLMGTRFLIAFAVLGIIFYKSIKNVTKRELLHCAILGLVFVISMGFELKGLQTTDSSVTAFLEGSAVITIPALTCIVTRKLPDRITTLSALIALVGVGFLTLKGGHIAFSSGELTIMLGVIWYSVAVLLTDRYSKSDDSMVIAIFQLLFIGLFSMIAAFFMETPRLPQSSTEWAAVLALALICSGVGFTLQPIGQKYTTPERAGIMSVFNPLSAAFLGVIFLHEQMTLSIVIGGALIIASTLAPVWMDKLFNKGAAATDSEKIESQGDTNE